MATFQVTIQKTDGHEFWTNDYFLDSSDLGLAHNTATTVIAPAEQGIHNNLITINKARTSTVAPADFTFLTTDLDLVGTYGDDANPLPLFNVVRVDIAVGLGRPGRKFYRLGWGVNRTTPLYRWMATEASNVTTAVEAMRLACDGAGTPITNKRGDLWVNAVAFPLIGMRQLRKGSKRKEEPVI